MKHFVIFASCVVFASASALAQSTPSAGKGAPASTESSADLAPPAVGKPTKTVGGATRSIKKNPQADGQPKAKADAKPGDAKPEASVPPRK